MSRKKPLSVEEKRTKIIEIFHETQDFFSLKEIEKIASKEKGVVLQSVKEVLDSLVSDSLVRSEKIGTSNYFWAFPSAAFATKNSILNLKQMELSNLDEVALDKKIEAAMIGREETEEREALLAELKNETKIKNQLEAELLEFKDCDPILLEQKEKEIQELKTHANRWTDNIFAIKSYMQKNMNLESGIFHSMFEISEDFDNID